MRTREASSGKASATIFVKGECCEDVACCAALS